MKNIIKYKDLEYVICFLKGLNDLYGTVKTRILLMDPLPSINRVFSLVLQQERQLMGSVVFDNKVLINSANPNNWKQDKVIGTGWKSQGRGRSRNQNYGKQCSYCHKLNHTADECFSKHGFPPWYKHKNDRAINNIFSQNYAATNKTEDIDQEGHKHSLSQESVQFSQEQIQQILKICQESKNESIHKVNSFTGELSSGKTEKGKYVRDSWILDTGATDHVTHCKYCFKKFYKIKPIIVKLPNNSHVIAEHAGTVQLSDFFFYMMSYTFLNLLLILFLFNVSLNLLNVN